MPVLGDLVRIIDMDHQYYRHEGPVINSSFDNDSYTFVCWSHGSALPRIAHAVRADQLEIVPVRPIFPATAENRPSVFRRGDVVRIANPQHPFVSHGGEILSIEFGSVIIGCRACVVPAWERLIQHHATVDQLSPASADGSGHYWFAAVEPSRRSLRTEIEAAMSRLLDSPPDAARNGSDWKFLWQGPFGIMRYSRLVHGAGVLVENIDLRGDSLSISRYVFSADQLLQLLDATGFTAQLPEADQQIVQEAVRRIRGLS